MTDIPERYDVIPEGTFTEKNWGKDVFMGMAYDLQVYWDGSGNNMFGYVLADPDVGNWGSANWTPFFLDNGIIEFGDKDVVVTMPQLVEIYNLVEKFNEPA